MSNKRIYWLHTLTPTHVGTGRGVGYIDLPIHRDKVTNWPVIPGSAFKGVWADQWRASPDARKNNRELRLAFGMASDEGQNNSNAGALVPTDARIVCLPVRSFQGTFAWCTSRMALHLLHRDLNLAGVVNLPPPPPEGALLAANSALREGGRVYLEDLDFDATEDPTADAWAKRLAGWVFPDEGGWRVEFVKRFAVLPDTTFDFLTETGTEVDTRVRIAHDTKTVAEGQLWTGESLPAESILAGIIACDRVYSRDDGGVTGQALLDRYAPVKDPLTLQIGGKATVGRGQVRCVFTPI
jgi:CRISPR-associated protein Cmr4